MTASLPKLARLRNGIQAAALVISAWLVGSAMAQSGDRPVNSGEADHTAPSQRTKTGVSGRVTVSGSPVADAVITVRPVGPSARPLPDVAVVSDAEGRFMRPLPPGEFVVTVVEPGGARKVRRVNISEGRTSAIEIGF